MSAVGDARKRLAEATHPDPTAAAVRAAQAEALRVAARRFVEDMAGVWGGDSQWLTTGTRVAEVAACVLREMAADMESECDWCGECGDHANGCRLGLGPDERGPHRPDCNCAPPYADCVHPPCDCAECAHECDHEWLDRPESDTRECLICGTEVAGRRGSGTGPRMSRRLPVRFRLATDTAAPEGFVDGSDFIDSLAAPERECRPCSCNKDDGPHCSCSDPHYPPAAPVAGEGVETVECRCFDHPALSPVEPETSEPEGGESRG